MVLHSDDWGRAGMPDAASVERLSGYGYGKNPWDWYGLETPLDLENLSRVLRSFTDASGRPACFTANFILANPDLRRMRQEGFREFHAVPIKDGFPEPWQAAGLMESYRRTIRERVFYPGLHGFVHFGPDAFMAACRDAGDLGNRIRALVAEDIPYAASLTPEFNFALVTRTQGEERFIAPDRQQDWIGKGVDLFAQTFGHSPVTTCAPGYRCNPTTYQLWRDAGIAVAQAADKGFLTRRHGMLSVARNTFFEPMLQGPSCVADALATARRAVEQGKPVVVCTHSINYISRHGRKSEASLALLSEFLARLSSAYPDLRFSDDAELLEAWSAGSSEWFEKPGPGTLWQRLH